MALFVAMERPRILVVGAGLAGLALARSLAAAGWEPEVVDRAGGWDVLGTGIYLPANGTRALRALGLEQAARELGAEIARQQIRDRRGRVLVDVDLRRFWEGVGPCLALHRADLHALLREGVPVRLGTAVAGLGRVNGPVEVRFGDGREAVYDLVVGADGLRSTVRRLLVDDRPPDPVGQDSWRFVTTSPPGLTTWSVLLDRRSSFLTIPIGQGRVYCYADVLTEGGGGGAARDLGPLPRERFAGLPAPVPELLERAAAEPVHAAPIEQVAAEQWGRGAVVLVGDAAHGMSPNMAQGAALAFEDALVLTECLGQAASVPDALAAFVARRHPRASWVRAQTHRRDHTRRLPPPVRNPLLRAVGPRIFRANFRPLLAPA